LCAPGQRGIFAGNLNVFFMKKYFKRIGQYAGSGGRVTEAAGRFKNGAGRKARAGMGLSEKSQKANFTLFTEPVERIFGGNADFLVNPMLWCSMLCVLLSSCVTAAKVSKSKNFALTGDVPITVQSPLYPEAGLRIEEMLLEMGYHVVPYEVAADEMTARVDIAAEGDAVNGTLTAYRSGYVPAAVVISVDLSFYYPDAHFNFNGGFIRIFDLRDKKLLASFRYRAGTAGNLNDVCNRFAADFKKLVSE
jgi:hypothetical protein